jgi:hypothetical protein
MQQATASTPGDQDTGSRDGWLTALAVHRGSFVPLHRFSFESHRFADRILHFPSPGAKREVSKR